MSWLSKILQKIDFAGFLGKLKTLLFSVAGDVGKKLADIALDEVKKAELTNYSGPEKLRLVFNNIKNNPEFKDLPQYTIELAINGALHLIK